MTLRDALDVVEEQITTTERTTDAFREAARITGLSANSIQSLYYKRRAEARVPQEEPRVATGESDVLTALDTVRAAVADLATVIRERNAEMARLTREAEQNRELLRAVERIV